MNNELKEADAMLEGMIRSLKAELKWRHEAIDAVKRLRTLPEKIELLERVAIKGFVEGSEKVEQFSNAGVVLQMKARQAMGRDDRFVE